MHAQLSGRAAALARPCSRPLATRLSFGPRCPRWVLQCLLGPSRGGTNSQLKQSCLAARTDRANACTTGTRTSILGVSMKTLKLIPRLRLLRELYTVYCTDRIDSGEPHPPCETRRTADQSGYHLRGLLLDARIHQRVGRGQGRVCGRLQRLQLLFVVLIHRVITRHVLRHHFRVGRSVCQSVTHASAARCALDSLRSHTHAVQV